MNLFAFLDFINIFIAIFLGLDIHSKDPSNKLNKMFFLNSMLAAYTAFCEYFRLTATSEYWAYFWHKASFLWPLFPFIFLGIILQLSQNKFVTDTRMKLLFLTPALIFSALHLFTDVLYERLTNRWYGWEFQIAGNAISKMIPIYFIIVGAFSFYIILKHYKVQNKEKEKKKALFALIGLSIPALTSFIVEGFLPQAGVDVPPLNSVSFVIGTSFIYVSILKYSFLKLDPNDTVNKLFETSADYMLIYDTEGNIILASKSLLNVSSYIKEEVEGNNIASIFGSFNNPKELNHHEIIDKEIELYLKTKNSEFIPTSVTITKVESEAHNEFLYFLTARDLRERKQFEEELLLMHKNLEEKVNKRTVDLTKANEKLVDEIKMRTKAEEIINKALSEKETLLKEIHHRVKNNLQVISSLLFLQSQKSADPFCTQILQESQRRIRTMALVHEHLYSRNDFSQIVFADYVKNLYQYISSNFEGTFSLPEIYFDLDEVNLSLDLTIPLGLILNELFTNALKYAFRNKAGFNNSQADQIRVEFKKQENDIYTLIVSDNGIGLPEDLDLDSINSLGLKMVQSLVAQINGKFEYIANGEWKEFIINFNEYNK